MIINSAEPLPNINNPLSSIQENRIQKNRLNPRSCSNCDSVKTVPGTDKFCNEKAKEISHFCRKVGSQDQTMIVMIEVRWNERACPKALGKVIGRKDLQLVTKFTCVLSSYCMVDPECLQIYVLSHKNPTHILKDQLLAV